MMLLWQTVSKCKYLACSDIRGVTLDIPNKIDKSYGQYVPYVHSKSTYMHEILSIFFL